MRVAIIPKKHLIIYKPEITVLKSGNICIEGHLTSSVFENEKYYCGVVLTSQYDYFLMDIPTCFSYEYENTGLIKIRAMNEEFIMFTFYLEIWGRGLRSKKEWYNDVKEKIELYEKVLKELADVLNKYTE